MQRSIVPGEGSEDRGRADDRIAGRGLLRAGRDEAGDASVRERIHALR